MEAYATMSDFTTVDATTPNAYDNVIFTSDLIRYGFYDDGGYAYANPFNQWWTLTDLDSTNLSTVSEFPLGNVVNFFKFWSKNEALKPEIGDTASVWTISKLNEPNV